MATELQQHPQVVDRRLSLLAVLTGSIAGGSLLAMLASDALSQDLPQLNIANEVPPSQPLLEYFPSLNFHPAIVENGGNDLLLTRQVNLVVGQTELVNNPDIRVLNPDGQPYDIDYAVIANTSYKDIYGFDRQVRVVLMAGLADGTEIMPDLRAGLVPNGGVYEGQPSLFQGTAEQLVDMVNQHLGEQLTMYTVVAVSGNPTCSFGDTSYAAQCGFFRDAINTFDRETVDFETNGFVTPAEDFILFAFKLDL